MAQGTPPWAFYWHHWDHPGTHHLTAPRHHVPKQSRNGCWVEHANKTTDPQNMIATGRAKIRSCCIRHANEKALRSGHHRRWNTGSCRPKPFRTSRRSRSFVPEDGHHHSWQRGTTRLKPKLNPKLSQEPNPPIALGIGGPKGLSAGTHCGGFQSRLVEPVGHIRHRH